MSPPARQAPTEITYRKKGETVGDFRKGAELLYNAVGLHPYEQRRESAKRRVFPIPMSAQSNIDISFHYPPELMQLLIDVIPLLNRSKRDVFVFFQGAGVSDPLMVAPYRKWKGENQSINKYEIVREVLVALNERGESALRERREVLKRVVEFESFDVCWPNDSLKARGLISEIQRVTNTKDSFTRMKRERDVERNEKIEKQRVEQQERAERTRKIEAVHGQMAALFGLKNPQQRGKALEQVLNDLFRAYGILVKEAFCLTGDAGEGIVEQVDGVIEHKGEFYLVEMKWWKEPIGVPEISQHLVRVYHRSDCRAVIISASDYTESAIATCKDALQHKVVILCTLEEIVHLLREQGNLESYIDQKVKAAILEKKPYVRLLPESNS
jgi:restriction endonuclease Mrr